LVPGPIDGDTLQALAKIRVGRVRVGREAPDDVRVDLVKEELGMFCWILKLKGTGAGNGREGGNE
jgi:hypothetical protein